MYANPADLIYNALARAFAPRKARTVSQWADACRMLSKKGSAEPGPWRTMRNPPLAEPMDCLSARSTVRDVVLKFPIQFGKTEVAANVLGYTMDENPGPIMVCLPGEVSMFKWVQQKLNPMIEESPAVADTLTSINSRDASNTRTFKDYRGGQLYIEHAGSPSRLKSTSVRTLIVDELDEFAANLHSGDDPVDMLLGRTSAFPATFKRLFISTPQVKGLSRTEQLWDESDQRRYYVPCPHCGHEQPLEWSGLQWFPGTDQVQYLCKECATLIDEHHKTAMIAAGRWIPDNPTAKMRGYHINCLYYPIGLGPRWADLVEMWQKAQNDLARLKTFINDRLAEAWEDPSLRAAKLNTIADRAEDYRLRTAPLGVCAITAGVDTQDDRLEVQIVGWGKGLRAWTIDYVVLWGNPSDREVWDALTVLLNTPIEHVNGHQLPILATFQDSAGHKTNEVYDYARRKEVRRFRAVRGATHIHANVISRPKALDYTFDGRTYKRGVTIQHVGTVDIKNILFGRIGADADKSPEDRMVHFSNDLPPEFFAGILSEIPDKQGRYVKKRGSVRNESLDTWVYAFAATRHQEIRLNMYSDKKWDELAAQYAKPINPAQAVEAVAAGFSSGINLDKWGRK